MPEGSSVKSGVDPRKGGAGQWLKIEAGEPTEIIVMCEPKEFITVEQVTLWLDEGRSPQWAYTGAKDPMHDLKLEKRSKTYLPVVSEGESKIWAMPQGVNKQLWDTADAVGSIKGMVFVVKKTGSGLKTRYSITQKGMAKKVPAFELDIIEAIGPTTTEGVIEMLEGRLSMDYDDIVATYGPAKSKKSKGKAVELDTEEEFDDLK